MNCRIRASSSFEFLDRFALVEDGNLEGKDSLFRFREFGLEEIFRRFEFRTHGFDVHELGK